MPDVAIENAIKEFEKKGATVRVKRGIELQDGRGVIRDRDKSPPGIEKVSEVPVDVGKYGDITLRDLGEISIDLTAV